MATVAQQSCAHCGSPIGNRVRGCPSCRTAPRFRGSTILLAIAVLGTGWLMVSDTAEPKGPAAPATAAAAR